MAKWISVLEIVRSERTTVPLELLEWDEVVIGGYVND